ncbi:MAG TPA: nicotinamide-nucleotide amidohydrolase family protein, partial [Bacteroidales bacterium]|nr:nicotinamide-nucleotide amidohydrolase family protein [Bacteroidales bacterium]
VGESFLSEMIRDWENNLPANFRLAYLPQPGMVRLRITGRGPDKEELNSELEKLATALVSLIPDLVFGYGEESPEEVLGRILKEKHASISTAESCTGGYIAHLITSIAGSSAYFTGSVVAYSNQVKVNTLGVKESTLMAHGAVSEQTVIEMANGVKKKFGTDYAIAVSGIAGPDGGTREKAVGTIWIALAGPRKTVTEKYLFGRNRERNIRLAALTALNKLRLLILRNEI